MKDYTQQKLEPVLELRSSQKWQYGGGSDDSGDDKEENDDNDWGGSSSIIIHKEQVYFAKCIVGSHTDNDVMKTTMQMIHMPNYYNLSVIRNHKVVMIK